MLILIATNVLLYVGCTNIALANSTTARAQDIVDPINPQVWLQLQHNHQQNLSSWPVTRIEQLKKLEQALTWKIAQLPRHCPIIPDKRLGYHSTLELAGSGQGDHHIIEFIFDKSYMLEALTLVPALNPLKPYGGSYAFPARFKIEVAKDHEKSFTRIVDWFESDFPNPDTYPVYFNNINQQANKLRITVPAKTAEQSNVHFALGEVFIWAKDPQTGDTINLLQNPDVQIKTLASFEQTTKWNPEYLTDQHTSLGFAISEQQSDTADFLFTAENELGVDHQVELMLELPQAISIKKIQVWPAKPSGNLLLPDFAFPASIQISAAESADFNSAQILEPTTTGEQFGTLYSVNTANKKVKYIRIQLADLQQLNNQWVLGLGEIAIVANNGQLVNNATIKSKGLPLDANAQLNRLLDGYVWGRTILTEQQWLKGLAKRRPLDQQLKQVKNELAAAHSYWQWLLSQLTIVGLVLLFLLLLLAVLFYQKSQRNRALIKHSERINRDLHDEVGSSLGGITLLADSLAQGHSQSGELLKNELDELSLMAREANASLREIVWHSKGDSCLLPDLLQSLFERAQRVLRNVVVEQKLAEHCPKIKVSTAVKKHLSLFFKEVINNCARHSGATHLSLIARCEHGFLILVVEDNGCGFNPDDIHDGWGLKNLQARAEELSADLKISAVLNQGVRIELKIDLNTLSLQLGDSYQTSN
ncbi:sensor histidine kinase [Catenovulum agarivorans]|nr:histidine kinase [Catenovulum agarivorans]